MRDNTENVINERLVPLFFPIKRPTHEPSSEAIRDRQERLERRQLVILVKGLPRAVCSVPPSLPVNYFAMPRTARSSCGVPSVFDQSSTRTPIITPITISAPVIPFSLVVVIKSMAELKPGLSSDKTPRCHRKSEASSGYSSILRS